MEPSGKQRCEYQQQHQEEFARKPGCLADGWRHCNHGKAGHDSDDHGRNSDETIQAEFHQAEQFMDVLVRDAALAMVDEQAVQVQYSCHPADNGDDMQPLPEHVIAHDRDIRDAGHFQETTKLTIFPGT